jgi:hypothetical protein
MRDEFDQNLGSQRFTSTKLLSYFVGQIKFTDRTTLSLFDEYLGAARSHPSG